MKIYYALISVFLIVFHLFAVSPVSHENNRLNAIYRYSEKKLTVWKKKLGVYDQVKSNWLQQKDDFDRIKRILPDEGQSLDSLLDELSINAEQAGVSFSMNHHRPASKAKRGFYCDEYYGITLEGPMDKVHIFVRDLSEYPRIIDVVEWSFFLNTTNKNSYHSELILRTVSFWVYRKGMQKRKKK